MNSRILKQVVALTLAAAASVGAPAAVAQTEPAATGLEEIVVTARKREEVLMEVPVAISVLTADDLEKKGVLNLQDVAMFTPGLSYFDAIQNQLGTPVVRGISQTNLNSPDRNVAIFYGGVYLANSNASNLEMLDVARVEVVKGPQSALYGRNAFMGAINFVPAAPTQQFYGKGELTMGSDERLEARLKVAGPLTDTLGGRFAVSRNTFDGTWENIGAPNDNLGGYETTNVSGMLQWDPSDEFSGRLFGFWTDDRRDSSPQYYAALNCGPGTSITVVCGDIPVQEEIGAMPDALAFSRKVSLFSLDSSYDFGPMSLSGQLAYYKAVMDNYSDYQTGTHGGEGAVFDIVSRSAPTVVLRRQAVPYYVGAGKGDSESWSAELRLASNQNQRLRWMVGGFYFENEANTTGRYVFDGRALLSTEYPRDAFGLGALATRYTDPRHNMYVTALDRRNDEQLGFFGTLDFDITDSLTAGVELRHDDEDRSRANLLTPTVAPQEGSFSYNTWRANVDWKVADGHMIYASAAKG
ncbi:MAG: TonB-dependent receptor, partial [Gammaproteobacteria bacterium]|nr:TonB-dependent receptor [Gammaproteobacteria bacterium]